MHFGRTCVDVIGDGELDLLLEVHLGSDEIEDVLGGLAADGRRGGGVGEERAESFKGEAGEGFGLFAKDEGTVVLGVGEGDLEVGTFAAPVGDGIAVDTGLRGGFGDTGALGDGVKGDDLRCGEDDLGHACRFLIRL